MTDIQQHNAPTTVCLLPGLDGSGELFAPFIEHIPQNYSVQVIRYPANPKLDWLDLAAEVEQQLPINGPILLIAESFAGPIAVHLLSRAQRHYRKLVLCATFAQSPRPLLLRLAYIGLAAISKPVPVPRRLLRRYCLGEQAAPALIADLQRITADLPIAVLRSRLKLLADFDVRPLLAKISLPVVYLQAGQDKLVPARCVEPFQAEVQAFSIHKVSGPHFLLQVKPKTCADFIFASKG